MMLRTFVGILGCTLVSVLFGAILLAAAHHAHERQCHYMLIHNEMGSYNEVCR